MKRYDKSFNFDVKKKQQQSWRHEHKAGGFKCSHCKRFVVINDVMGTTNRNYCNRCLWSKHVDNDKGDRASNCQGGMQPTGLTFKHDGYQRQGELMLVHRCVTCQKVSINRIARDDYEVEICEIFERSLSLPTEAVATYAASAIELLVAADSAELQRQLYGKPA